MAIIGNEATIMVRVRALIFDVFGTLVDWRTSVAREAQSILCSVGARVDGFALADAWRDEYQPAMDEVRSGRVAFSLLDVLHRRNLDRVLERFELKWIGEDARQRLNFVWHRLDPWPDTTAGLARLRARYLLAPCSNGNIAIMVDLARHNGWVWDAIAGSELARAYKPQPVVYLSAAAAFGCGPEETLMVAAHSYDLAAASALGLRTAFIARPDEFGPGKGEAAPSVPVDFSAETLTALADALGCP